MDFWKMNGAGNDFIILDDMDKNLPSEKLALVARTLCRRHMSVGADGLMVVRPAEKDGDYRMLFYNADGSAAEMCGNGARCVCRYGYENGLAGPVQKVETPSGTVRGRRIDRRRYEVRLNSPTLVKLDVPVQTGGRTWPCSYVELGSPGHPHAVVPYAALAEADENELRTLGRQLRYHEAFPKGANVSFYEPEGEGQVRIRTYERGVEDLTLACGTGTASVALVLATKGILRGDSMVAYMPGGTLAVTVRGSGTDARLFLTGPTNIVCKGKITDEELEI